MFIVRLKRILHQETLTVHTAEADVQAEAHLKTTEHHRQHLLTIADHLHAAVAAEAMEAEAQVQEEAEAMVAEVTEVEAQAQEEADAAK